MALVAVAWQFGCKNPEPMTGSPPSEGGAVLQDASALGGEPGTEASHLYMTKCARCHKLYNPQSYSEAQWQRWVSKMSRKAKLTKAQHGLLIGLRSEVPMDGTNH